MIAIDRLQLHPRVAQQGITLETAQKILESSLPKLAPFDGRAVTGGLAVLDWDHRLPSRALTLRLHLCYQPEQLDHLSQAFAARTEEIARGDRYPEFDVPDYAGLPSDESYEVELSAELTVEGMRLVSPWRRDIDPERTRRAVETVRGSTEFQKVEKGDPDRPRALGDLEAVAWTPPCESGQPGWTVDVWWLTLFDGRVGKGWSFLVDLGGTPRVVSAREFAIRAS